MKKPTPKERHKIKVVKCLLDEDTIDPRLLRRLAASGLVTPQLRKRVWPMLLGISHGATRDYEGCKHGLEPFPVCRDADQVEKDVVRSLWRLVSKRDLEGARQQLTDLLNWALDKDSGFNYYQGLHDIASVLLVQVSEVTAAPLLLRLMHCHLREYLTPTIDGVLAVLQLMLPIITAEDPLLGQFLCGAGFDDRCHFALSWMLTWFAHALDEHLAVVARLFDFFLATHPLMPMYLSVAVVLQRRREVLRTECSFPEVHSLLTKVPHDLPWEHLIVKAMALYKKYEPQKAFHMAQVPFDATSALLRFPYVYMRQTLHSERYWLLKATPEERAAVMTEAAASAGAGELVETTKAVVAPHRMYQQFAPYFFAVSLSALGYAVFSGTVETGAGGTALWSWLRVGSAAVAVLGRSL